MTIEAIADTTITALASIVVAWMTSEIAALKRSVLELEKGMQEER